MFNVNGMFVVNIANEGFFKELNGREGGICFSARHEETSTTKNPFAKIFVNDSKLAKRFITAANKLKKENQKEMVINLTGEAYIAVYETKEVTGVTIQNGSQIECGTCGSPAVIDNNTEVNAEVTVRKESLTIKAHNITLLSDNIEKLGLFHTEVLIGSSNITRETEVANNAVTSSVDEFKAKKEFLEEIKTKFLDNAYAEERKNPNELLKEIEQSLMQSQSVQKQNTQVEKDINDFYEDNVPKSNIKQDSCDDKMSDLAKEFNKLYQNNNTGHKENKVVKAENVEGAENVTVTINKVKQDNDKKNNKKQQNNNKKNNQKQENNKKKNSNENSKKQNNNTKVQITGLNQKSNQLSEADKVALQQECYRKMMTEDKSSENTESDMQKKIASILATAHI